MLIVGIGGTTREGSNTELALGAALAEAESLGAQTVMFGGKALLAQPLYDAGCDTGKAARNDLVDAVRAADGVIIASPGYHGSISGLVKNALDGLEDLRADERPYLDGRAVGLIVTADGPQAGASTLAALRSIVHSLRGWPTPLGVSLNLGAPSEQDEQRIALVARQVVEFARRGG